MATPKTAIPDAPLCPVCKGNKEVSRTVRVGRKRRPVGEQTGICLKCFGTGKDPDYS
ncbi:hypothetical protein AB0B21_20495 [Streptomyces rimosus]|uniref:hypothetical protein n=1 Tax=Streptomyces rimosus TaxID=1927 RepID=UPI0018FEC496